MMEIQTSKEKGEKAVICRGRPCRLKKKRGRKKNPETHTYTEEPVPVLITV